MAAIDSSSVATSSSDEADYGPIPSDSRADSVRSPTKATDRSKHRADKGPAQQTATADLTGPSVLAGPMKAKQTDDKKKTDDAPGDISKTVTSIGEWALLATYDVSMPSADFGANFWAAESLPGVWGGRFALRRRGAPVGSSNSAAAFGAQTFHKQRSGAPNARKTTTDPCDGRVNLRGRSGKSRALYIDFRAASNQSRVFKGDTATPIAADTVFAGGRKVAMANPHVRR